MPLFEPKFACEAPIHSCERASRGLQSNPGGQLMSLSPLYHPGREGSSAEAAAAAIFITLGRRSAGLHHYCMRKGAEG